MNKYLEELRKQATKGAAENLRHESFDNLAKLAGVQLQKDQCPYCGRKEMKKQAAIMSCECGMMKSAISPQLAQRLATAGAGAVGGGLGAYLQSGDESARDRALTTAMGAAGGGVLGAVLGGGRTGMPFVTKPALGAGVGFLGGSALGYARDTDFQAGMEDETNPQLNRAFMDYERQTGRDSEDMTMGELKARMAKTSSALRKARSKKKEFARKLLELKGLEQKVTSKGEETFIPVYAMGLQTTKPLKEVTLLPNATLSPTIGVGRAGIQARLRVISRDAPGVPDGSVISKGLKNQSAVVGGSEVHVKQAQLTAPIVGGILGGGLGATHGYATGPEGGKTRRALIHGLIGTTTGTLAGHGLGPHIKDLSKGLSGKLFPQRHLPPNLRGKITDTPHPGIKAELDKLMGKSKKASQSSWIHELLGRT